MSKKPDHTEPVPVIGEGATLGVIGAGAMGQTLLRGLLSGKLMSQGRGGGGAPEARGLRSSELLPQHPVGARDKNQPTCDTASEALGLAVEPDFRAPRRRY